MDEKWEVDRDSTLLSLLDRVDAGETVHVTRNGTVVAELTAVRPRRNVAKAKAAAERIRELRKGFTLGPGLTIKELINEGRK